MEIKYGNNGNGNWKWKSNMEIMKVEIKYGNNGNGNNENGNQIWK